MIEPGSMQPGDTGARPTLPLADPAFSFDGRTLAYADAVLTAMILDQWPAFVARCRLHQSEPFEFDEERASTWAEEFRRAHQLEAVADLDTWLAERYLDRDDFTRFGHCQGAAGPPVDAGDGPSPEGRWWAEAVLSGDARDGWVHSVPGWWRPASLRRRRHRIPRWCGRWPRTPAQSV